MDLADRRVLALSRGSSVVSAADITHHFFIIIRFFVFILKTSRVVRNNAQGLTYKQDSSPYLCVVSIIPAQVPCLHVREHASTRDR